MARRNKLLSVPAIKQESDLKRKYYGLVDSSSTRFGELSCVIRLQPSTESRTYKIRIRYNPNRGFPKAWIIDPPELAKVDGKKPHHIYVDEDDSLCVFYPSDGEWDRSMYLSETFVPWIVTWLSAYEYWQITGEWFYPEKSIEARTKRAKDK